MKPLADEGLPWPEAEQPASQKHSDQGGSCDPIWLQAAAGPDDSADRIRRTAELVEQLHGIVEELEEMHPGRKFTLDGHLVGSIGEAAAEAMFELELQPPSTSGHDAIAADGRAVEIKATYGSSGVGIRATSIEAATVLIVLRLSRLPGVDHEVVYNGSFRRVAEATGALQKNGQAPIALTRLRKLDADVPDVERVPRRPSPLGR